MSHKHAYRHKILIVCVLSVFLLTTCSKWMVPETYVGSYSDTEYIEFQFKDKEGEVKTVGDTISMTFYIHADNSVSGNIGSATIVNGEISMNDTKFKKNLYKTDYLITGELESEIIDGETIKAKGFALLVDYSENSFSGTGVIASKLRTVGMFAVDIKKQTTKSNP